jgi:heme-degrading monooxygenase HmoA
MIYEIAEIEVKAGHEADFVAGVGAAAPFFLGSKGCHSLRLTRSLEHPHRFRLMVEWATVDDHMIGFRNSDAFTEWRRLVGPHFASPPRVEHVEVVLDR